MDAFELRLRERLSRLDAAAPAPWPPAVGSPSPVVRTRIATSDATRPQRRSSLAVTSLAAVFVMVLLVGAGIWYARPTDPTVAGASRPAAGPAIEWDSGSVRLTADSLRIVTAWHTYTMRGITKVAPPDSFKCAETTEDCVYINSDGSRSDSYRTLELEWREVGHEQRLYIYLAADDTKWWATEIRVRDGRPLGDEDWLAWKGHFFETPLGQTWRGDLDLTDGKGWPHLSDGLVPTGDLHIHGMTLKAFD
jgi:hypothetical protein